METQETTQPEQQQQEWSSFGSVIGKVAVNIQTPVHFIVNPQGGLDVARATVSIVDGEVILKDLPVQVGDISNALVATYQHVVLGKTLADGLDRVEVANILAEALKVLNYKGASTIMKDTRDHGEFEFAGNTINWVRSVNGHTVLTNFTTTIVESEDGSLRQGTWINLINSLEALTTPEAQYEAYAKAYMGEGE